MILKSLDLLLVLRPTLLLMLFATIPSGLPSLRGLSVRYSLGQCIALLLVKGLDLKVRWWLGVKLNSLIGNLLVCSGEICVGLN